MGNTLFYIAFIVGVYLAMRFSKKIITKLISLVIFLVVAFTAAYLLGLGPFKPNFTDVFSIEEKYCESKDKDQDICDCIAIPMRHVITSKFSREEIEDMKNDKVKSAYVFVKTINVIKDESQDCLESKGREDAWKEFTADLFPFKIGLDDINLMKEKVTDKFEKRKDEKDSIDLKFED
jgi:hypothetical protein